ncbi:MAG: RNA polymerase [Rhizobiaceae bacterium]|nr:RNA polymerase [Rhizobiaceae bacterium]
MKVDTFMKDSQTRDTAAPEFSGAYAEIPRKLKAYYDSLQDEAIPDRFLDLLEKLEQAEQAAQQADSIREFE